MYPFLCWLLALLRRERHEIGRKGLDQFLTRWVLLGNRDKGTGHKLYLHCFHRGDSEDYPHDHPWAFWSLILWGGYYEWSPAPGEQDHAEHHVRRWYGPGSLLRRPAEWRHRVELAPGRKCWTLIWCGPKVRSWGFWCPRTGFRPWREHQASQDAGGTGCD